MRPIATIKLDAPDAEGTIRGVVLWSPALHHIYVHDPRKAAADLDPESPEIPTIEDALDYTRNARGYGDEAFDLQWLVEDPLDFD